MNSLIRNPLIRESKKLTKSDFKLKMLANVC